jgi:cysteine-rich repeat protein
VSCQLCPVGSAILPVYSASGGPQGKGHVTFDRTNSQYLDAGPRSLNIASNGGLTIVAVVRFTGTAADYERIIDLHMSGLPETTAIMMYRNETSSNVGLEIRSSWGIVGIVSSGEIVQDAWLTVVARYRASTREYWLTVNENVFTGTASAAVTDRTASNTWIARAFDDTKPYFNGDIAGVFVVDEYLSADATSAIADLMVRGVDLTADTSCSIGCGFKCSDAESHVCSTACGDSKRAGNETCDDGNTISGDGCSADCKTVEPGWTCTNSSCGPSTCTPPTTTSTPSPTTSSTSTPAPTTRMPTTTPHVITPMFVHGLICQSSAWPCAANNITVCFSSNSKLNSYNGLQLRVSGLKGLRSGAPVPVQDPQSGDIQIQTLNKSINVPDYFNNIGDWDRTRGDLTVNISQDLQPYQIYCFRFLVVNPSLDSECARVSLSIRGIEMNPINLSTANSTVCSLDLIGQGTCQNGYPSLLRMGGCPLSVVRPEILVKNIGQSTAAPCSVNTVGTSPQSWALIYSNICMYVCLYVCM